MYISSSAEGIQVIKESFKMILLLYDVISQIITATTLSSLYRQKPSQPLATSLRVSV